MKKLMRLSVLVLTGMLFSFQKASAQDPITLIIQEGITKVIVAVDLKIQRLQNEVIWLQNAQKVVENALSDEKLKEIAGWVEKQKGLYEQYFEELWQVRAVLSSYSRLRAITEQQQQLLREYGRAWKAVQGDRHFSPQEVAYMGQVYSGLLERSVKNLQGLSAVIRSFNTQMSDGERLTLINRAADDLQQNLSDLRDFNRQNLQLSLARALDETDRMSVQRLYGF